MKLYHGTSERVARLALTEGLLPRSETGEGGNWEDNPSNPDLVYLTRAYALYFAYQAVPTEDDAKAQFGHRWGVVEIDTDLLPDGEWGLLPDEDFLEQASRGQDLAAVLGDGFPEGDYMNERTDWFRDHLHQFAHLWEKSVEGLGNCAYDGPIPPEAVTRVALYDPRPNRMITMAALDPCIAILNYQFCGTRYRTMIDWLFGAEVSPLAFTSLEHVPNANLDELPEEWRRLVGPQLEAATAALADRSCIELLTR